MAKRYISNIKLINYYSDQIIVDSMPESLKNGNIISIVKFIFAKKNIYNGIVIFNPSFLWLLSSFILKILSLGSLKIILFDLLLHRPETVKMKLVAYVKNILFISVDLFVFFHKDISLYVKNYNISKKKSIYIPFKANNFECLNDYIISDNGFLLSCGASYRDYKLLAKALKLVDVPVKIVLPQKDLSYHHKSIIDENEFGGNVEIVRHDFDRKTWYEYLSKCRCVVLPIRSNVIQCAGVSVYLEAMAFGKPVIISEGPSTRDILTPRLAAIFPPDDHISLANLIKRVWNDVEYRESLSRSGKTYALSLGGEERLVKDLLRSLISL